ncbi:MAG TPA: ATP-binding cassette domain-containing protein, partial [Actinoplanes sp.]|nr:ATP-binding cassette domain-containing protein [Actinoplanes sp.]
MTPADSPRPRRGDDNPDSARPAPAGQDASASSPATAGDHVTNAASPATTADGEVVLELRDVVKTFPGVRALDGVQLEVRAGEVHCLLGQNGAGKSTLIKVLAGVHHADEGTITWQGVPFAPATPQAAMKAGIATIYQELDLVDDLSVAENAFLGHEDRRVGFVR